MSTTSLMTIESLHRLTRVLASSVVVGEALGGILARAAAAHGRGDDGVSARLLAGYRQAVRAQIGRGLTSAQAGALDRFASALASSLSTAG